MTSRSGDEVPVDIWAEVFDRLLGDAFVFNPDPFSVSSNPHTMFRHWYNYDRLADIERQRLLLRLVSSTWKALADNHPN